jgi:predicted RND superfamily exporter protein
MNINYRLIAVIGFLILGGISAYYTTNLKFSFDFEQFFPEGDEDLAFFRDFIEEFEADDNFLLIAIRRENGVFEQSFLEQFHDFTLATRAVPHVLESQSLTKFAYPVRTPFTFTTIPAIHIDQQRVMKKTKRASSTMTDLFTTSFLKTLQHSSYC